MTLKLSKSLRRLSGSASGDHQKKRPEIGEAPNQKEDARNAGDVKESRQVGETQLENESRYRGIVEAFDGLIYICSPDYRVEFMNQRLVERIGYDGTGEYCYKVLYERSNICPWCVNKKVFRGETVRCEVQSLKDNRWYYVVNTPIYRRDGRILKQALIQDITELKQTEAALRQIHPESGQRAQNRTDVKQTNEQVVGEIEECRETGADPEAERQRVFSLLDELPVYVYLHGGDHTIRYANRVFREHFGEPQGRPCYDILRGGFQPCEECSTKRVLATQSSQESQWTSPSGRVYRIYGYPFTEADGSALVLKVGIDITERRQAEEALYQEKERYRILVEAAPSGISIIGKDGRYKYLNPKFERLFGYTLEDIPTGRDWFPKAFPDSSYREMILSDWKEEFKKPQVGEVRPRTFRVTCKDGTVKVVDFRSVALATGDWLIFYEDISQRVQAEEALVKSEEQYRLLVNQIPAVVFKGYADGRIEFFDCKIESLTGYKKEDFDTGRLKWPDLILKEDAPGAKEVLLKALRGYRSYVREYRIRKQDGGILWIQGRGHIFCNATGQVNYISGVLFDISERKRAEQSLRRSEQKLRALATQLLTAQEDERKRLAAELHDELGHALLTLKLSIRSLEKQLTPEQFSISQELKKMGRFIGETIKEVRRLYHDLSPGDLEDLGLTETLRDMIEDVAALQMKIKWKVVLDNLEGIFPLPVQTAIYRVVQEALTNIGKHAKPKNVVITAKREDHGISIIIEDDGRGFEAAKVLDTKRSLGLLTMEERVKILGGTFTLWSQKNQGTRISFFVPVPEGA